VVVGELLLSRPNLILLPQPPVVLLTFHLLRADGNGGEQFVRLRGCQLNSSSVSIMCNILRIQTRNIFSWPKSSPLIFSLYNIINRI
jgi:hypothetical protein